MSQPRTYLLDIPIDFISKQDALERIIEYTQTNHNHLVVTPYASFWYWAIHDHDDDFMRTLQGSDLSLPDGTGVFAGRYMYMQKYSSNVVVRLFQITWKGIVAFFKIINKQIENSISAERITGVDLVADLISIAEEKGLSMYFLGGWPETVERLDTYLKNNYPELQYKVDIGSTAVRTEHGQKELTQAIERINQFQPDILLVAFGPPFQEKWSLENKELISAKVTMCVGATFDLLSGQKKRAPQFLQKVGLEWLWRFIEQPTRWRRIYAAFPWFPLCIALEILNNKQWDIKA